MAQSTGDQLKFVDNGFPGTRMSPRPASFLVRLIARCLQGTYAVDRLYLRFDRMRSTLVLAFASDTLLEQHRNAYYARRRGRSFSRDVLFEWEQHAIKEFFPPPPARVLVGGAGRGREAFGLAGLGYSVAAFDIVPRMVDQLRAECRKSASSIEVYQGAYQDLPILAGEQGRRVDLRDQPPFDAAVVGYGSFGELVTDSERTDTLRRFAEITRGPILVSFFANSWQRQDDLGAGRLRRSLVQRARRRGLAKFVMRSGFNRLMSSEEVQQTVDEAGVSLRELQCRSDGQPYFVVTPLPDASSKSSSAPRRDP
jgi:hypothetical protein